MFRVLDETQHAKIIQCYRILGSQGDDSEQYDITSLNSIENYVYIINFGLLFGQNISGDMKGKGEFLQ
jgi:hypothetical protein